MNKKSRPCRKKTEQNEKKVATNVERILNKKHLQKKQKPLKKHHFDCKKNLAKKKTLKKQLLKKRRKTMCEKK